MSEELERATKIEAGMTEIKGTHFLMKRIEFTDEFFDTMRSVLEGQITVLLKKKERSPQDEQELKALRMQLMNLEAYKQLRKSGVPWAIAKEDNDMSERLSCLEQVFARNWMNPTHQRLLFSSIFYTADIAFADAHVKPAPTVLVMNPSGSTRLDVSGFGHKEKEA